MAPALRERLSASFVRRLCQDRVEIHRSTIAVDGMGGQTTTWRKVATIPARLINKNDAEQIIDQAVRPTAVWEMLVHASTDIQANDRITFTGQDDRIFDVIGTDQGQTELLVQKVGLVERTG